MRHPPLTVNVGVSVPVQGINVSKKSQKLLIVASRAARQCGSVVPDLKPDMMKWKVLKELDLQPTTLEEKKNQYDTDVLVTKKKDHYFVKCLEEFVLCLISAVGVRGVSFAYLAHTNE